MNHYNYTKVHNPSYKTEFYIIIDDLFYKGTVIHIINNVNEPKFKLGYYSNKFTKEYCTLVTDKNIIAMLDKIMVFQ